jgi:molybdopterin converting factor subunit 1
MLTLHVQYFAILREQRGLDCETLETAAATPAALYDELRARHGFTLPGDRIRAAVNDAFVAGTAPLRAGDRVVFIPPVAGG